MSDHLMQPAVLLFIGMMASFSIVLIFCAITDKPQN